MLKDRHGFGNKLIAFIATFIIAFTMYTPLLTYAEEGDQDQNVNETTTVQTTEPTVGEQNADDEELTDPTVSTDEMKPDEPLLEEATRDIVWGWGNVEHTVRWEETEDGVLTFTALDTASTDKEKAITRILDSNGVYLTSEFRSTITEVRIEEGITGLGWTALFDRQNNYQPQWPDDYPTNSDETDVFKYFSNLKTVKTCSTIKRIGWSAFRNCKKLTSIDFSTMVNLEEIMNQAFSPSALQEVDLSACKKLKTIGHGAFNFDGISSQTYESVKLPSSLETIGSNAFYHSRYLKYVIFEDISSVTFVGNNAFAGINDTKFRQVEYIQDEETGQRAVVKNAVKKLFSGVSNFPNSAMTNTYLDGGNYWPLTIEVKDKTTYYNGEQQSGYEVNNVTGEGDDTCTVTGLVVDWEISNPGREPDYDPVLSAPGYEPSSGTNHGEYDNGSFEDPKYTMKYEGYDYAINYEVTATPGKLIIEKIAEITVNITGSNNSTDYDGESHTVSGYTYTVEPTSVTYTDDDFTFSGTAEATRTNKGKTNMGLNSDQFENTNDNIKTVNFVIAADGYQEINPIDVTVKIIGHNNTADYDGDEHTVTGYDFDANGTLYTVNDFTFDGTAEASRTNKGKTNMGLAADQFTNTNDNFATVSFEITDGYQQIDPIEITVTVTGHHNTTDYDGDEHTVTGYDIDAGEFTYTIDDYTFTGTASASRTNAGTEYMGLSADQFTNTNENFSNVTFEITDGYQTINAIDVVVTITGHNVTEDYDGNEYTANGYDFSADSDLYTESDFTFSGTAEAARTEAGTTNMNLASNQFENTNSNFANVTFNVTDGYVKINPIDVTVTITGHHNATDYDGEEHTVTGYDFSADNDLYTEADFTFSGTAEASRTNAGTEHMNLTASQFQNISSNFDTVTFNITDGYQTINPIDVTVKIVGHNNTTDYDGDEHTVNGYDFDANGTLYTEDDFTFSGTASASRTNKGKTNMNLAANQFHNTNNNFATVTFQVTDGYQKIDPIDVTVKITGHNDTTDYDGDEHTVNGYDFDANGTLYTENDFTFSGTAEASRTNKGKTTMGLDADQFTNTNENFANVTFEITDGYQQIDPIDVTVKIIGHNDTADYDSNEHTVNGYDFDANGTLYKEDDFTFSGTASASRTNAGTEYMGLEADQFTNTNENFATVTFQVTDGYQKIDPIDVTVKITGHNDATDYDGDEHTVSGYDFDNNGTLYTEDDFTFSGTAEASRTEAGTTYMNLADDMFENTNDNFATVTFDITDGYQKIRPIDVTVTIVGHNDTKEYNGGEQSVTGYDFSADNDLYTEDDFTFSGSDEAARTDVGTTDMGLAEDQFENTSGNFRSVTFVVTDGYIEITKKKLTITTGNATKQYDGTALTSKKYTVSGLAAGDKIKVTTTGSRTAVGSSKNTYKIKWGSTNKKNYDLTDKLGTLTVTPAPAPAPVPVVPGDNDGLPVAEIGDDGTPMDAGDDIEDPAVPTESPQDEPYWALINLICMLLTVLICLIMLARYFLKREGPARIAGLIPAIIAVIVFILTEDMRLPMQLVDKWTILMIVILAIEAALALVMATRNNDDEEYEE